MEGESQRSFLGKAGPLVFARFITAGLTVCIPLILARMLDLEGYGTYKQIFLWAWSLYLVVPFGMAQSLYFFIPRAEQTRPYYVHVLLFTLAGGILSGIGLWVFGPWIASGSSNPQLMDYRWQLSLFTLTLVASVALEIGLTSQGKTKQAGLTYLVSDGTRALVLIIPVVVGWGLMGSMVGLVIFTALRLVYCWWALLRGTEGPSLDRHVLTRQLSYAAPFGAAVLLGVAQQYGHQFAMLGVVTPAMYAIYTAGCFQLPLVDLLYTPTSEVLMVRLGELEKGGRAEQGAAAFREAVTKLSFFFLPLAAFMFAAAPEFIGAVFGQKFMAAVPLFQISLVGVVSAIFPVDGVLRARNHTQHILLSYMVKAGLTVPLVYFGVMRVGLGYFNVMHFAMMGGIISFALAEVVGKLVLWSKVPEALSTPERRITASDLLPWRQMGKAALSSGAAAAGVYALRAVSGATWAELPHTFVWRLVPLTAAALLFAVGYLAVLRMTGIRFGGVIAGLWRTRSG